MKIASIEVYNYRLLKEFKIELEDDLSVVIGKNNTGKTSLLSALEKFLGSGDRRKFYYDDISVGERVRLLSLIEGSEEIDDEQAISSIGLKIKIEYSDTEDISRISKLITNLDPDDNKITLNFSYDLPRDQFLELRTKWSQRRKDDKSDASTFLRQNLMGAFGKLNRRSLCPIEGGRYIDLDRESQSLEEVIGFKHVNARRDVTNKDNDKTLSSQTARIYKSLPKDNDSEKQVEEFKLKLRKTDEELSTTYGKIFKDLIEKVKKFGGMVDEESKITIASTLQDKDIFFWKYNSNVSTGRTRISGAL